MRTPLLLAVATFALLAGCGPEPTMQMRSLEQERQQRSVSAMDSNQRIQVTRIGVFRDETAYQNRRGVYVIVDKQTGREYIGISGVGISEVGDHPAGKSRVRDER